MNPRLAVKNTQWQLENCWLQNQIPAAIRTCLLDASSTTRRFRAIGGSSFIVQVLKQAWQQILLCERKLLKQRIRRLALVREVIIHCNGQPWMFARAVFPEHTVSGKTKYIHYFLDERPLGDLLYREPHLQRSAFELAQVTVHSTEYPALALFKEVIQENLWARRSLFMVKHKPILLTEVFMPALIDYYCKPLDH